MTCTHCARKTDGVHKRCPRCLELHRIGEKRRLRHRVQTATRKATRDRFVGMLPLDRLWKAAKDQAIGVKDSVSGDDCRARKVSRVFEAKLRDAGLVVANVNEPPPGWTVEEDIREELLAESELVAMRKVG